MTTISDTSVTGGYSMARQLAEEGVTHIFGIPGVQLDYATNGLSAFRDQITFINARHEHTTTYAADGYARSTGRVGVALVVPGPGVLNAGAGLVTALACSSKVLLIAGQIPTRGIGQGLGLLHAVRGAHDPEHRVLGAALADADRDQLAVVRGEEPVDRDGPVVDRDRRVDQHRGRRFRVGQRAHDQTGLLATGVAFEQEQPVTSHLDGLHDP